MSYWASLSNKPICWPQLQIQIPTQNLKRQSPENAPINRKVQRESKAKGNAERCVLLLSAVIRYFKFWKFDFIIFGYVFGYCGNLFGSFALVSFARFDLGPLFSTFFEFWARNLVNRGPFSCHISNHVTSNYFSDVRFWNSYLPLVLTFFDILSPAYDVCSYLLKYPFATIFRLVLEEDLALSLWRYCSFVYVIRDLYDLEI